MVLSHLANNEKQFCSSRLTRLLWRIMNERLVECLIGCQAMPNVRAHTEYKLHNSNEMSTIHVQPKYLEGGDIYS